MKKYTYWQKVKLGYRFNFRVGRSPIKALIEAEKGIIEDMISATVELGKTLLYFLLAPLFFLFFGIKKCVDPFLVPLYNYKTDMTENYEHIEKVLDKYND